MPKISLIILSFIVGFFIFSTPVQAATLYFKAAGGNFNGANWSTTGSGGTDSNTPTAADDCILEAGSGALTINTSSVCRSLNINSGTGGYDNAITHTAGVTLNIGDATAGLGNKALDFSGGGSSFRYTLGNAKTSAVSFVSTSATQQTITTGGKTLGNIVINGSGNSYQLQDALTSSGNFTYTAGTTFDTNTKAMTFNGANVQFAGAGKTYYELNLTGSGSNTVISGANTFTNLNRTGTATTTDALIIPASMTVTGVFTLAGNNSTNRLLVQSITLGTAGTITNSGATMTWSNVDFRDVALGTAYDASAISGLSGDCGGNSGITFTTAQTNYWVGGTGGWSTVAEWANSSGGSASSGRVPLPQDDAVFDANSFSAGSQTVTLNMPREGKNINWTGATNSPTWGLNVNSTIYGSLTLISTMTLNGTTTFTMEGRSAFTWTSAGKTIANAINVQMVGGSLTIQDALITTKAGTLTNGTWNFNNFNSQFTTFTVSGAATRTITLGSGTMELNGTAAVSFNATTSTNLTVTPTTGTIKFVNTNNNGDTFFGGGKTWGTVWFSRGASTSNNLISGSNTFASIKDTGTAAHNLLFQSNTTQTVTTWSVSGTSGNVITINTNSSTQVHNLVKVGGGVISSDYLNIQHSVATPSSTWYAGTNSTNNQSVATAGSGWNFSAPVSLATKFMILNPTDDVVGNTITVTVQAQDDNSSIVTTYNSDVTLLVSGSATGGGLVDIINGVGTISISDQVAETVSLTLSDTQETGLDVTSTETVVFSPLDVVSFNQSKFWFRNDNGTEATATGYGSLGNYVSSNTNITDIDPGSVFRLRFNVKANNGDGELIPGIYFKEGTDCTTGDWIQVTSLSSNIHLESSQNFNNGESTTKQISPADSSFAEGQILSLTNPASSLNMIKNQYTEYEWSLRATIDVSSAVTYSFRIENNGQSINTYDQCPSLTIVTIDDGGGGNGGGNIVSSGVSGTSRPIVIFSGQAFPEASILIVNKGSDFETPLSQKALAGADGTFWYSFSNLTKGENNLFALIVKDKENRQTPAKFFNIETNDSYYIVKDILSTPTIDLVNYTVTRGSSAVVIGSAAPGYIVQIQIDGRISNKTKAKKNGLYKFLINTGYLEFGHHDIQVKQIDPEIKTESDFSIKRILNVSNLPQVKADLNGDGVIDIKDWSIFLANWQSNKDMSIQKLIDLNGDGKSDISDFSIFVREIRKK